MKVKIIIPYTSLLRGKIYDVVKRVPDNIYEKIVVINEFGKESSLFLFDENTIFEIVTMEYRNEVISELLN